MNAGPIDVLRLRRAHRFDIAQGKLCCCPTRVEYPAENSTDPYMEQPSCVSYQLTLEEIIKLQMVIKSLRFRLVRQPNSKTDPDKERP